MADTERSNPLAIVGVLLAVLLIAGGGTAAAVILTSDGDEDRSGSAGGEPSPVAIADWCAAVGELEDADEEEFDEDPSRAADLLREAGLPDDIPKGALRGRDLIIEIAEEASDGDEAEEMFDNINEADLADANAFFAYYTENCLDDELDEDEPTAPLSSSTERPSD